MNSSYQTQLKMPEKVFLGWPISFNKAHEFIKLNKCLTHESSPYKVNLDISNWEENYFELQRLAESSLDDAEARTFSVEPPIKVKVSEIAKIQMHLYHLIAKDESFRNSFCANTDKKSININKNLIKLAENALQVIKKICLSLAVDFYPVESKELKEYKKDKWFAWEISIDKNNRFVYRVLSNNDTLEILEVMFHPNYELLEGSMTQKLLLKMFNYVSITERNQKFPNYLYDVFSNLELEGDTRTVSEKKLSPQQQKFKTGRQLVEYLENKFKNMNL